MLVATQISRKAGVQSIKQEGILLIFLSTSSASKCKRECALNVCL